MSIKAIDKVWSSSQQSGVYLLALIALADYAHDNGTNAFPKMRTLRKKLRYKTDRAVQKILSVLIESGELVRHDQKGPNGVNLFDIIYQDGSNWDLVKNRCKKYNTPLRGEQMDTPSEWTPPPVHLDTPPTGEQMDTHNHEPSVEPINNNSPESDSPEFPPIDPTFAKVSQLYKQEINPMFGSTTSDLLKDLADNYPLDWIEQAFKIAVKANARRLDYIEGILKRWQEKGHPTLEKQKRGKSKEPDTERIDESQYVEVVPEEESHELAVDESWLDEQFKKFRGGQNGNS